MHTLDAIWTLLYYLDRTRPFRSSQRLFAVFADSVKGQAIATCLNECLIVLGHAMLVRLAPPMQVRMHSTRAQVTSVFSEGMSAKKMEGVIPRSDRHTCTSSAQVST